jgi:hypothetical protein
VRFVLERLSISEVIEAEGGGGGGATRAWTLQSRTL